MRTRTCLACHGTGKQPAKPPPKFTQRQLDENQRAVALSWEAFATPAAYAEAIRWRDTAGRGQR